MSDIGPHILSRGIVVRPDALKVFLERHGDIVNRCSQIQVNGSVCSPEALQRELRSADAETISLTVVQRRDDEEGGVYEKGCAHYRQQSRDRC